MAAALLGLGSCAAPGRQEIHLAPLWSDLSLAGGDREVEALGGAALARWSAEDDRLSYWALRPLVSWTRLGERRTFTWILPPLGSRFRRPEETARALQGVGPQTGIVARPFRNRNKRSFQNRPLKG